MFFICGTVFPNLCTSIHFRQLKKKPADDSDHLIQTTYKPVNYLIYDTVET